MISFLRKLLLLILLSIIWITILWFGITPNFRQWPLAGIVAGHVLPPLSIWSGWLLWRRFIKRKQAAQGQMREQQAQAERQAALEEARRKRGEEQKQRRFACDCRAIAISHLVVNDALELPAMEQVLFHPITVAEARAGHVMDNLLDGLETAVADALRHVYAKCAAASVFPLYVVPPPGTFFEEVFKRVRAIYRRVADELALPIVFKEDMPSVRYLTTSAGVANAIIDLFESSPDLPGAVIVAFDSPLLSGDTDPERGSKPSHGAFALLVTHMELPAMLENFSSRTSTALSESMTPFWEKGLQSARRQPELLNALPMPLVTGLGKLPILGRIHQSVSGEAASPGAMELTRLAQKLIDRAQVNAGMIDLPAVGESEAKPAQDKPAPSCAWVVHNAGGTTNAGHRLAAILTAMSYFGVELHPAATATNSAAQVGDLNQATSIGMLALALAQVAAQQAPVLYTEFSQPSGLTTGFAVPAPA